MEFQRHFLGWDKPFTLSFTEQLKEDSGSRGQLDECLIWVPSSRAGRHILSELFTGEAEATEAFHPPRFTTPAQYERSLPEIQPCASIPQQLLAWKSILQEISPEKLVDLFPAVPLRGKNQWAFSVADQLIRIRQHLQDNGHDFTTVARSAPDHDKARWLILADLEGQYLGNLQAEGLTDPGTGFVERIKAALAVAPFKRLLVAGVLNLSHRQVSCIKVLSEYGIRIEFYLPIPQEFSESLDEWCRPRVGYWDQEAIPGELLQGSIQRSSEPRELVDRVLDLADVYEAGDEALVIGSPESETAKYIVERSRLTGTPLYMPQGKALKDTAWGRLCRLLSKLGREGSTRHLMELLRHSLFRKWAQSSGCDLEAAEAALLNLHREHLILDLEQLADPALRPIEAIGTIKPVLNLIKPLLAGPAKGDSFPEWLWSVLQEIRQGIKLSSESRDVLGQLEECLQDLRSDFDPSLVNTGDYWEILTFLLVLNLMAAWHTLFLMATKCNLL